jgi:Na+/melibiose symporter-like transporter
MCICAWTLATVFGGIGTFYLVCTILHPDLHPAMMAQAFLSGAVILTLFRAG